MSVVALGLRVAAFRGSRQSARHELDPRRSAIPQVYEVCRQKRFAENSVSCLEFRSAKGAGGSRSPCGQRDSLRPEAKSECWLNPSKETGRNVDRHRLTS